MSARRFKSERHHALNSVYPARPSRIAPARRVVCRTAKRLMPSVDALFAVALGLAVCAVVLSSLGAL